MRKNRFNNGYIGINRLDNVYDGVVSIEKYNDIRDYSDTSRSTDYIRPSNGNGYGAIATAKFINSTVAEIIVLDRGGVHGVAPTLTFSGGGGTGATGVASIYNSGVPNGKIASVTPWYNVKEVRIVHPGIGYTSTPSVTFSAPSSGGTTATGTAVISNGRLVGITITNPGSRYLSTPTITLGSGGASVGAVAVPIIECGTGYTEPPTITFSGGSTAIAICRMTGLLGDITVTAGGTGYTEPPTAIIKGYDTESVVLQTSVSGGSVVGITHNSISTFVSPLEVVIGGWTPLPSITDQDEKLVAAYKVTNTETNPVAFIVQGAYTVNWGNGIVENYNSGATATYNYHEGDYAGFTMQDPYFGYKTAIITITPQAGHGLTLIDLNRRHPTVGPQTSANTTGWLDIAIAGRTLSSLAIGALSPRVTHRNLEQFNYIGQNSITGWSYMFADIRSLRKIVNLDLRVATGTTNLFSNCFALDVLPDTFVSTRSVQNSNGMFSGCYTLKRIPNLNCDNMNNVSSMFANCYNLERLPTLQDFRPTNTAASMFQNCYSLVEIPYLDFSCATSLSTLFGSCFRLEKVPPLPCTRATSTSAMFQNCYSLKEIPYLDISSSTDTSNMFANCVNLTSVPFLNTHSVSSTQSMFSGCYALKSVPEMNLSFNSNNTTMFFNCTSLREAKNTIKSSSSTIYSGSLIRTLPLLYSRNISSTSNIITGTLVKYFSGFYTSVSSAANAFQNAASLSYVENINLDPAAATTSTLTHGNMFENCSSLEEINGLTFGFSSSTIQLNTVFNNDNALRKINMYGVAQNITLPNPSMLGPTALNNIYTNLATVGASGANAKTITVTGSWGTASDNPMIAISKGWAVTG